MTTEITYSPNEYEGPVLALVQTDDTTLRETLATRLEMGPVGIIDPDGTLSRYYQANPDEAPNGWWKAQITTWAPLNALECEYDVQRTAAALLAAAPQSDDTDDIISDHYAEEVLQVLLLLAVETDTLTLDPVIDWTLTPPTDDNPNPFAEQLDVLFNRYEDTDQLHDVQVMAQALTDTRPNMARIFGRLHAVLEPWHSANRPVGTFYGNFDINEMFDQHQPGTIYLAPFHERRDVLRPIRDLILANILDALVERGPEDIETAALFVAIDQDELAPLPMPDSEAHPLTEHMLAQIQTIANTQRSAT